MKHWVVRIPVKAWVEIRVEAPSEEDAFHAALEHHIASMAAKVDILSDADIDWAWEFKATEIDNDGP